MQTNTTSDDLTLIRLIAEEGTLAGAARRLGVNHATAFRRLNAIETRLHARLFERGRAGYSSTAAGEAAIEHARRIEEELVAFEHRIAGAELVPSGTVRLATTDTLLAGLLAPILANFRRSHPAINIEVATSNTVADLTRRAADLALRPAHTPPETFIGRCIGRIEMAAYAERALAKRANPLTDAQASWIGPDETFGDARFAKWFAANELDARTRMRANTFMGILALTEAGHGFAVLPTYLADKTPVLARVSPPIADLATDLWLLRHPALKHTARIKVLSDFLADGLSRDPRLNVSRASQNAVSKQANTS